MASNLSLSTRTVHGLGSVRSRTSTWSVWGFVDQAVISATTLLTMALLARALGASDFGLFTLGFTIVLFANNLQTALVTTPHNVLGASLHGGDYSQFTTSSALLQLGLILGTTLLVLAAATASWLINPGWTHLLLYVALVDIAWQIHEFTRRVLYTRGRSLAAITTDVVRYGSQVIGLVVLWRMGLLTVATALLLIAASAMLGFLFGLTRIVRHFERPVTRAAVGVAIRNNWRFGKWMLGSTVVSWISGQLYPILIAGLVSVTALGASRAVMTLMGPTNILMRGLETVFPPRASTVFQQGGMPALVAYVRRIALVTGPVMVTYCLVVAVFSSTIVRFLFGSEYVSFSWLVIAFAVSYLIMYFNTLAQLVLTSAQHTSPMFRAQAISAAIVLTFGVEAVHRYGLKGGAAGMVVHSIVLGIVLWHRIRQLLRRETCKA